MGVGINGYKLYFNKLETMQMKSFSQRPVLRIAAALKTHTLKIHMIPGLLLNTG